VGLLGWSAASIRIKHYIMTLDFRFLLLSLTRLGATLLLTVLFSCRHEKAQGNHTVLSRNQTPAAAIRTAQRIPVSKHARFLLQALPVERGEATTRVLAPAPACVPSRVLVRAAVVLSARRQTPAGSIVWTSPKHSLLPAMRSLCQ
jgi:hypothetical protein